MHPREVLTADDVRTVGFQPARVSEEMDGTTAHVYHEVTREGDRWTVGLGVFLTGARPTEADAYWADLLREAEQPDAGWERPAVGDQAVVSDGWLYLRWRGHVLWTFAEGPDPVVARRACEQFARIVCDRIDATTRWITPAGFRPDPSPPSRVPSVVGARVPVPRPDAGVADPAEPADPADPADRHRPAPGPARRPVAWPALVFACCVTAVPVAAVLGARWVVLAGLGALAAAAGALEVSRARRRV